MPAASRCAASVSRSNALALLPAVGLDPGGAVLCAEAPLPSDAPGVAVPSRRGMTLPVECEVLDVDAVVGRWKSGWCWRRRDVAVGTS